MKKIFLTFLFLLGTAFVHAETKAAANEVISFTLTDSEGGKIHVSELEEGLKFDEYQNKAVFLILFGHMCPPCNAEIPEFIELIKEHSDKLAIVGLEAQGYGSESLHDFREEKGINYSIISAKEHDDFIGYIAGRAQWNGQIPLLIALDKHGAVQFIQPGYIPKATLEELIEKLNK